MFWVLVFHLLTTDICSCSCISHNARCWQFASGSHILIVLLSNHLLSDTHCSIGRSLAFDFVWNWWFSWNFNGSGSVIISHSRRSKFWKLLSIGRSLNSTEISSNRSNLYKSCLVCARAHTHTRAPWHLWLWQEMVSLLGATQNEIAKGAMDAWTIVLQARMPMASQIFSWR